MTPRALRSTSKVFLTPAAIFAAFTSPQDGLTACAAVITFTVIVVLAFPAPSLDHSSRTVFAADPILRFGLCPFPQDAIYEPGISHGTHYGSDERDLRISHCRMTLFGASLCGGCNWRLRRKALTVTVSVV